MLEELLTEVVKERNELRPRMDASAKWERPKIVVKIAPDLNKDELEDIAVAVRETGVDGVIVSNTTIQRPSTLKSEARDEIGGLSGPPLRPFSLKAVQTLRSLLPASIPIIGCGGISSGADALEFARAGATTVQIYTAFGYDGVGTPRRIKDELAEQLHKSSTSLTWNQASKEAVEALSYVPPKEDLSLLEKEAHDLKMMLDSFEPDVDASEPQSTPPTNETTDNPTATEGESEEAADQQVPAQLESNADDLAIEGHKTEAIEAEVTPVEKEHDQSAQETDGSHPEGQEPEPPADPEDAPSSVEVEVPASMDLRRQDSGRRPT
jgi:dihydroorotate dehydrogenase